MTMHMPPPLAETDIPALDHSGAGLGLRTLWVGRLWLLAFAMLALALGGIYAYRLATPVYRTHAVVMLEPREQKVVDLGNVVSMLGQDEEVVTTQVSVLRSRVLMERLVQRLGLTTDPEFNASLRERPQVDPKRWLKTQFVRAGLIPATVPRPPTVQGTLDGTINALLRKVTVSNEPKSLIFHIAAETGSAVKSARIANALADIYLEDQLAIKLSASERASDWLAGRIADLRGELMAAEAAVGTFRAEADPPSRAELAELDRRQTALRQRQSEPGLDAATVADLIRREQQMEGELIAARSDLRALERLDREAEQLRQLHDHFLARLKETALQPGLLQADARILSRAIVPIHAAAPKPQLILALALILGLGTGSAFLLGRAQWYGRFRTAEDLAEVTGQRVLGQIPQIAERRRSPLDYAMNKPTSLLAEAVRDVRTSVLVGRNRQVPQVIMLTSCVPDEGKSTTAAMLAQNMAGWGKRVLLIEADVRRQSFERMFGIRNHRGILSVLARLCTLEEAVVRPDGLSIDVLMGEASSTNAADLFATVHFERFLAAARGSYDFILIDTPPVLAVTDARVIAPMSDAVIVAVRWNRTTRVQVRRGLQSLQAVRAPLAGVLLTRVDQKRMERQGYGRQYGHYARKSQFFRG